MIEAERSRNLRLESAAAPLASAMCPSRGLNGEHRMVTAHDRKSQAHAILGVAERVTVSSTTALAQCAALRENVNALIMRSEAELDEHHAGVARDIRVSLRATRAEQSLHLSCTKQRMHQSIDRQEMPLKILVAQLADAEALASEVLACDDDAALTGPGYSERLDRCAIKLTKAHPDRAFPFIVDNLKHMESSMAITVDAGRWRKTRATALSVMNQGVRDMVHVVGVAAPIQVSKNTYLLALLTVLLLVCRLLTYLFCLIIILCYELLRSCSYCRWVALRFGE